jgi:hypothetical protein
MAVVCHFPVTVRVCGKLTDKRLAMLSAELEQALLGRITDARLELARRGLADASITFRESLENVLSPKPPIWQQPGLFVDPLQWPDVLGPEPTALDVSADDAIDLAVRLLINALDPLTKAPRAAKVDWTKVWPMVVQQVRSPQKAPRKGVPPELFEPSLVDALKQLGLKGGAPLDKKEVNRRQTEVLDRAYAHLLGALGMTADEDLSDLAARLLISALEPFTKPPKSAKVRWGKVWLMVVEQVMSPRRTPRKGAPVELYVPTLVSVLELLALSGDGSLTKEESDKRKGEVLDRVYAYLLDVLGQLNDEDVIELSVRLLMEALEPLMTPPRSAKVNWVDVWPTVVEQVRSPQRTPRKGAPAELHESSLVNVLELLTIDAVGTVDEQEANRRKATVLDRAFGLLLALLGRVDDESVVDLAVRLMTESLEPLTKAPRADAVVWTKVWRSIINQVTSPRKVQRAGDPDELYDPDLVDALELLSAAGKGWIDKDTATRRKVEVLDRTYQYLLRATDLRLGKEAGDPAREWKESLGSAADYMDGDTPDQKFQTYVKVRSALLAAFGALDVGTEGALKRIKAFYTDQIVRVRFLGQPTAVHTKMSERLGRAQGRLLGNLTQLADAVDSVQGTSIRPNANNALALSLHSFGFAVDMNPTLNPNIPNFPAQFIEDVVDVDLLVTAEGRHKKDVFDIGKILDELIWGKPDPALRETARLLQVSQQFQRVFSTEASLAQGLREVAQRGNAKALPATGPASDAELLTKLRDARAEGSAVQWRFLTPQVGGDRRAKGGPAHDLVAELLFPIAENPLPQPVESDSRKRATIELMIQMVNVFDRSVVRDKAGHIKVEKGGLARIKPATTLPAGDAALPQIAAHGFVNLPEKVIEALRAKDGGDLKWLGPSTVHDFMHFELKLEDQPNKY